MPYSQKLEAAMEKILAGFSGNQASIRVAREIPDATLSTATLLKQRQGQYGFVNNLRLTGRAFRNEIRREYGAEVAELAGLGEDASDEQWAAAAGEYLVYLADPRQSDFAAAFRYESGALSADLIRDVVQQTLQEALPRLIPAQRLFNWVAEYNRRTGRTVELRLAGGAASLTDADVEAIIQFHEHRTAPKDVPAHRKE